MVKRSSESLRQCVVTRERLNANELLRFVLDPSDTVVPDLKRKLPGRGVWVTARKDVVKIAIEKQIFRKAFRKSVIVTIDLIEQIALLMQNSALQKLALANKAGQVTTGFSKIEAALSKQDIVGLIHATAASADSCRKLDNRWRNLNEGRETDFRFVNCFSGEQLSIALGRANAVHAALRAGGASSSFLEAVEQLENYSLDIGSLEIANGHKSDEV